MRAFMHGVRFHVCPSICGNAALARTTGWLLPLVGAKLQNQRGQYGFDHLVVADKLNRWPGPLTRLDFVVRHTVDRESAPQRGERVVR
jgi:hypothetical protein